MMNALAEPELQVLPRKPSRRITYLPKVRASIADVGLESEPELDICPCREVMVLFVNHHPIAVIPGTSLEYMGIAGRLHELRHRYPRKK